MICVIAKLPPDAADRLNILRRTVASKVRLREPLYGHITIATCLSGNEEEFVQACSRTVRETHSFPVRYEKIEVLPETSIIVATPSKPDELLALHSRITEKYGRDLDRWTCGDNWYPHTTLLYDPAANLEALCREMQQYFIPFETRVSQIQFSKAVEKGYTILETADLN